MRNFLLMLAPLAVLAACTTDDFLRVDGVTAKGGDAIAANTVMQMVDPWQPGVQDTDLEVPAQRSAPAEPVSNALAIPVPGMPAMPGAPPAPPSN